MKARKWICALLALVIILGIMGYVPVQAASHDDVKMEDSMYGNSTTNARCRFILGATDVYPFD